MNKRLTAKVQQIIPNLPSYAKAFSNALVIPPDDEVMKERKGVMYAVFDISGTEEFDVALVSKVAHDVLHDAYFQSDNASPIQSLEKSIVEVRDRVTKLSNESIRNREPSVDFNMLAAVLWGNVVYVVQYGKTGSFLMREGGVRPVHANSEGYFSAASGVVKGEDVVIFSTQKFMEKIDPDKLLHSSVSPEELPLDASCLILKFVVDTSFSETEVVDFAGKEKAKKRFGLGFWKKGKKDLVKPEPELGAEPKPDPEPLSTTEAATEVQTPADADVSQETKPAQSPVEFGMPGEVKSPEQPKSKIDIRLKPKKMPKIKPGLPVLIVVIAAMLAASIFFSLRRDEADIHEGTEGMSDVDWGVLTNSEETPSDIPRQEEDRSMDEANRISRAEAEVFYDIKLADTQANPTGVAVLQNYVVVSDKSSGRIFYSDRDIPRFTAVEGTFSGVDFLENRDGSVGFTDTQGYKILNLNTGEATVSLSEGDLGVTTSYLGNIYSIKGDTLTKYEGGVSSVWARSSDFEGASSMAISIGIYVLKGNELMSFTRGVRDNFTVSSLDTPFSSPVEVITNLNFENIYVADRGNRRVVVLNKNGEFVSQIRGGYVDSWQDIKGIGVSPDERLMFLLDGSRVYEIELR